MIVDSVTEIHMRFVYAKVSSSGVACRGWRRNDGNS